jgi:hypothetical protein
MSYSKKGYTYTLTFRDFLSTKNLKNYLHVVLQNLYHYVKFELNKLCCLKETKKEKLPLVIFV